MIALRMDIIKQLVESNLLELLSLQKKMLLKLDNY